MAKRLPRDVTFDGALRRARLEHERYKKVANARNSAAIRAQVSVERSADELDVLVEDRAGSIADQIGDPLLAGEFAAARSRLLSAMVDFPGATWLLADAAPGASRRVEAAEIDALVLEWSEWFRGQIDSTAGKPRGIKDPVRKRAKRELANFLCGLNQANLAILGGSTADSSRLAGSLLYRPPTDV